MSDLERRLRAELLLLVLLAESAEDASDGPGVRPAFEDHTDKETETRRHEFEGALRAAVEAKLLPGSQAKWFRGLQQAVDEPAPQPTVAADQRAELDGLLERLARKTVAAGRSPEASHAHVRFQDAVEAADVLGLLDGEQRHYWDRRIGVLHGHRYEDDDEPDDCADDEKPEPLLGLKAVLPGPAERNGKQVISIECYDGGLVLRSKVAYEVPGELRAASPEDVYEHFRERNFELDSAVHVTDDAGTEYWSEGGGGGSDVQKGYWVSTWTWGFSPGVSPEARALSVHLGDERFDFDVAGVAERPAI